VPSTDQTIEGYVQRPYEGLQVRLIYMRNGMRNKQNMQKNTAS